VPEFLRLPRPGSQCRYSGLSRSALNALALPCAANDFQPPVESRCLRQRGKVRGIRLIVYGSLMRYLHSLPRHDASDSNAGHEARAAGAVSNPPQDERT